MSAIDLVQVMEVSRKSGVIHLRSADESGELSLRDGRIVDARQGGLGGRRAAIALLGWERGSFQVDFRPVTLEDAIDEANASLLVAALVAKDEASRGVQDSQRTQPPGPSRRARRRSLALAAVTIFVLVPFQRAGAGASTVEPSARHEAPRSADGSRPPLVDATTRSAPSPDSRAPADSSWRTLVVLSSPPGVEIIIAGHNRGTTPARVNVGRLTRAVELRVRLDGYTELVRTVGPGRGWQSSDGDQIRVVRAILRAAPEVATVAGPVDDPPPTPAIDALPSR